MTSDTRQAVSSIRENPRPNYGASDRCTGPHGKTYFDDQSAAGAFKARINRNKFAHLIKPEDTVIDFGCGAGFLLASLNCSQRIGVEINPFARHVALDNGIECVEQVSDIADPTADVVISDHALEHVPFPIGALNELRQKLKLGGILAVCVPTDSWYRDRRYTPDDRNHHLHSWTVQQFGNTLCESGYEIINIGPRNHRWPGRYTVACFGRLPLWMFDRVCRMYSFLSRDGRQVFAVARRPVS